MAIRSKFNQRFYGFFFTCLLLAVSPHIQATVDKPAIVCSKKGYAEVRIKPNEHSQIVAKLPNGTITYICTECDQHYLLQDQVGKSWYKIGLERNDHPRFFVRESQLQLKHWGDPNLHHCHDRK